MQAILGSLSKPAVVAVVLGMLALQSCSGNSATVGSGGTGSVAVSGLEAPLTDEALSVRAPIILVGLVTSKSSVKFIDDPFLPAGWESDEDLAKMVEGGAGNVKYAVNVTSTIKGATASQVWAVRGADGEGVTTAGAGPPAVGVDPEPGSNYKFWLEPYEWFGQEHYVLLRARPAA